MAATVAHPPSHERPRSESSTSPGGSPGGFIAVNGKESQPNSYPSKTNYDQSRPGSQHAHHDQLHNHFDRNRADSSASLSQSRDSSDSGPHKRKRSPSNETNGYSPVSRYDCSPPKRHEQHQHMADRALHVLGSAEQNPTAQYTHPPNGDRHGDTIHVWNGHPSTQQGNYTTGRNGQDVSDSHLAEALQQATQDNSQPQGGWRSRDGDQDDDDDRRESYSQERTPGQAGSIGPGGVKRKRNFSNRTKTGCLTCRKRKKKCDEQHPKCNNCERGGFECEGYNNHRDAIWKPTAPKAPVALQAKDPNTQPHPTNNTYIKERDSPDSRSAEGAQMRPITIDDSDNVQPQFMSSPQSTEPRSRPSYPGQSWPSQGHSSYSSEHAPPPETSRPHPSSSEYTGHKHRREHSRPSTSAQAAHVPPPPPSNYAPPTSYAPSTQTPPSHSAPPPQQAQWQGPPSEYRQPPPYHPPPPLAQRADTNSSHPPSRMSTSTSSYQSGPRTFSAQEVEKSKMLRGAFFNFLDPMLENERQRCEEALDRYNNACKLRNAAEKDHREKLLQKVFDPTADNLHHPIVPCKEKGTLGPRVKIEAPFLCTYGYNISLREDCYIGKNCNIDDAAKVEVGQRTWIGPNVTILTTDVSKDMVDRKGWESRWVARPVHIASEVVVGQGAVIYPGVSLAKGSTVEPYAIVKQNLGENQTQQAIAAYRYG